MRLRYNGRQMIQLISGFTNALTESGMRQLEYKLLQQDIDVKLDPWTTPLRVLRYRMERFFTRRPIMVVGFSYGANLAARLSLQVPIDHLVLIDPVHRPAWLPKPLPWPLSVLPRCLQYRKIKCQAGFVAHFAQFNSLPQSWRLKRSPDLYLETKDTHATIDNNKLIHQHVLERSQCFK